MRLNRIGRWFLLFVAVALCGGSLYIADVTLNQLQAEKYILAKAQAEKASAEKVGSKIDAYRVYDKAMRVLVSRANAVNLNPDQWLRNPIDMKKSVMDRLVTVNYLTDLGNSSDTLMNLEGFNLRTARDDDDLFHLLKISSDISLTLKGEFMTRRLQE